MVCAHEADRRRSSLGEEQRASELHGVIRSQGMSLDELARKIGGGAPNFNDDHLREIRQDSLHELLCPGLG